MFHQHTSFSYQGFFDPGGAIYANIMHNFQYLYPDGSWERRLFFAPVTYPPGLWRDWIRECG